MHPYFAEYYREGHIHTYGFATAAAAQMWLINGENNQALYALAVTDRHGFVITGRDRLAAAANALPTKPEPVDDETRYAIDREVRLERTLDAQEDTNDE